MEFVCECGKKFYNAQSFNGHKSNCQQHLAVKGVSYSDWKKMKQHQAEAAAIARHKNIVETKEKNLAVWLASSPKCEHCGKVMIEKFGSGRFCSRACANSKKHSEAEKAKISASLKQIHPSVKKYCKMCGKQIRRQNTSGLCITCFYNNYPEELRKKQSEKMKNRPRWNIHRNQSSFAEKFWEKVLTDYNISFTREVPVKYDDQHCYFLDFEIIKNGHKIDLEIDGKQHKDRKDHDVIRDEFLSKTYLVYRIEWNDIKYETGKQLMHEKIKNFILLYNNL